MNQKPIYVEIKMQTTLDELWQHSQQPDLHQQWDLRFSTIEYLPRPDETQPQRFLYATRLGFGLHIAGEGESAGTRHSQNGLSTSALKFWSDDPKSLIHTGSGYWQYIPNGRTVTFLTRYDYDTRFGAAGRFFDTLIFRPLLGWATAWSFDRLRLWLEKGIPPPRSPHLTLLHALTRLTLAAAWLYQGLIPKLLFPQSGEIAIWQQMGRFPGQEATLVTLIGTAQLLFALTFLLFWRAPALFVLNLIALLALGIGAAVTYPPIFTAPFSPLPLTLTMAALSLIGLLTTPHLPSATRCRRTDAKIENPKSEIPNPLIP
jgi:hypothetical protein